MARILLVEDDGDARHLFTRWLEGAGHVVLATASGEAAIAALDTGPYDLAVIDVVLPGVNGFEVARRTQSCRQPPGSLLISVSDQSDLPDDLRWVPWVQKPFSHNDLLRAVDRALADERA